VNPASDSFVLLGGGIESATVLHLENRRGPVRALFIDYGQRAAAREREAATAQCAALALPLEIMELGSLGETFRRGHTWQAHVPLPHRNLVLLGLAFSYAADRGAKRLCLALNLDDAEAYASASPPFVEAFRALAATLDDIEIATPIAAWNKAEVIRRGLELGVDYALSYSCLLGRTIPCGTCPQCEKRRAAFAAAGAPDPAIAGE
jgi:7-cyano-7-deazaguanine synthase